MCNISVLVSNKRLSDFEWQISEWIIFEEFTFDCELQLLCRRIWLCRTLSTCQPINLYIYMEWCTCTKPRKWQWDNERRDGGGGGEGEIEQTTIYYIKQISVWTSNIINISCILATVLTVVEPRKPYPKFFCFTWNTQNKYILAWEQRKLSLYSFLFSLNHINY